MSVYRTAPSFDAVKARELAKAHRDRETEKAREWARKTMEEEILPAIAKVAVIGHWSIPLGSAMSDETKRVAMDNYYNLIALSVELRAAKFQIDEIPVVTWKEDLYNQNSVIIWRE